MRYATSKSYRDAICPISSWVGAPVASAAPRSRALGHLRLSAVERNDVQDFVDRLLAAGLDPSTIKNTLNPLQAIYRRAIKRGAVAVNPTAALDIARPRGRRERIATPAEAGALIAALPVEDRALWATAMYAGLRRGELSEPSSRLVGSRQRREHDATRWRPR